MNEREFEAGVRSAASVLGWRLYHTWNSRHSAAGFPDLVLVRPPELIVAELKTDKGKLTLDQRAWLDALDACGIETHVWRPRDWEQVIDRLKRR